MLLDIGKILSTKLGTPLYTKSGALLSRKLHEQNLFATPKEQSRKNQPAHPLLMNSQHINYKMQATNPADQIPIKSSHVQSFGKGKFGAAADEDPKLKKQPFKLLTFRCTLYFGADPSSSTKPERNDTFSSEFTDCNC